MGRLAATAVGLLAALLATPAPVSAQQRGGTLVVAYNNEQRNLNPALEASNAVFLVSNKVIEQLFDLGPDGSGLKPLLATGFEGTPDGKTVTFTLRKGVTWHDGVPFTSADVAFSALEVWKKHQNFGRLVFRNLEAVDTPDAHTAVFRFSQPISLQLLTNALPDLSSVVPKHLLEGTDIKTSPFNLKLVGTGPFRFTDIKRGEYVILDRNPDYWDAGKPYLDRLVYRVLPDKAAIAAAHEAGEIQLSTFTSVPLGDINRLKAVNTLAVTDKGYEGWTFHTTIEFNHERKELKDRRVREAIHRAIDVNFVVDSIFQGYAKLGTGPVPSTSKTFYSPDVPRYPYDPKLAEKLLDDAGFPRGPDGVRFRLRLLAAPWFEYTRLFGDYTKQALKAIGIETTVQTLDFGGHVAAVYKDHNFDIATGSHAYRNDPAISTAVLYRTGTPAGVPWTNQYAYANPEIDRVIDAAAGELDPVKRVGIYKQFQTIAQTDLPLLPLIEHGFVSIRDQRLQNTDNTPRWPASSWADLWLKP